MQRTYQGSLDIKISVKPTRLLLNWVTTWGVEEYGRYTSVYGLFIVIFIWTQNQRCHKWFWIISYSFRSPLAVRFTGGKTVFDDSILGLSHDLVENRKTVSTPNMSDMLFEVMLQYIYTHFLFIRNNAADSQQVLFLSNTVQQIKWSCIHLKKITNQLTMGVTCFLQ